MPVFCCFFSCLPSRLGGLCGAWRSLLRLIAISQWTPDWQRTQIMFIARSSSFRQRSVRIACSNHRFNAFLFLISTSPIARITTQMARIPPALSFPRLEGTSQYDSDFRTLGPMLGVETLTSHLQPPIAARQHPSSISPSSIRKPRSLTCH